MCHLVLCNLIYSDVGIVYTSGSQGGFSETLGFREQGVGFREQGVGFHNASLSSIEPNFHRTVMSENKSIHANKDMFF